MSAPIRTPDIFWEIVDNPPVTDRWQRHVLLVLAKRQSEQGAAVALLPEELVRTGFSLSQVRKALHRLVDDREAQAGAGRRGAGSIAAEEGLDEVRQGLRR